MSIFKKSYSKNDSSSELCQVIANQKQNQTESGFTEIAKVLKSYVDNKKWVLMPVKQDSNGLALQIIQHPTGAFAVMYSDESQIQCKSESIVCADINKFFEATYSNPNIDGIVIDPDTSALSIPKDYLLKFIFHDCLPETNYDDDPPKDWGTGIPQYTENDLMSAGELLNFAIQIISNCEKSFSTYRFISSSDHIEAVPNLIFDNNGEYIFIVVKGYCALEAPELSKDEKTQILNYCKTFNAIAYYAPIGIVSTDPERFNAWLALKGDGFYTKYVGLEEIK